jgi:hypothetical protein
MFRPNKYTDIWLYRYIKSVYLYPTHTELWYGLMVWFVCQIYSIQIILSLITNTTRGSALSWARVAHLSFCSEET